MFDLLDANPKYNFLNCGEKEFVNYHYRLNVINNIIKNIKESCKSFIKSYKGYMLGSGITDDDASFASYLNDCMSGNLKSFNSKTMDYYVNSSDENKANIITHSKYLQDNITSNLEHLPELINLRHLIANDLNIYNSDNFIDIRLNNSDVTSDSKRLYKCFFRNETTFNDFKNN